MNAQTIIKEMTDLDRSEKMIFLYLAEIFDNDMPLSLYLDPYELAYGKKKEFPNEGYEGNDSTTHDQWERFLEIPEIYRYRHGKIAKQAEFDAIKAMQSLKGRADVSALKEIIKVSKNLQGAGDNNREKVILTYVKPKQYKQQEVQHG